MAWRAVGGRDGGCGLLAVKNLGRAVIEAIIAEREANGPFTSLPDFIERMHGKDVNKRAIESLIKSGAFDCFPHNRMEMMRSFEGIVDMVDDMDRNNVAGQMDLFGTASIQRPRFVIPSTEDYSFKERMAMEKEMTGLFLSGHPLDGIFVPRRFGPVTPVSAILAGAEEGSLSDGATLTVLCTVQARKVLTTRSRSIMAFLSVEDKTGGMEVIVFSNVYEQAQKLFAPDSLLVINGKISLREDEPPKLICAKAVDASGFTQKEPEPPKVFIKFASRADPTIPAVKEVLQRHPGESPVYFFYADERKNTRIKNHGVNVGKTLENELKNVTNYQNVVIR